MRSIDWLNHTATSLKHHVRDLDDSAPYVAERLSSLLLDRLPRRLSNRLVALLPPEVARSHRLLRRTASADGNRSIGYITFVEAAQAAVGVCTTGERMSGLDEIDAERFYRDVADAFLWAVMQELPPDLKGLVEQEISADLRARMNLYSASAEESKVA